MNEKNFKLLKTKNQKKKTRKTKTADSGRIVRD